MTVMAKWAQYLLLALIIGFGVSFELSAAVGRLTEQPDSKHSEIVWCANGQHFLLLLQDDFAIITIGPRQFSLQRQELSVARYYRSPDAALAVDGEFIAFIPRDDTGWKDCRLENGPSGRSK